MWVLTKEQVIKIFNTMPQKLIEPDTTGIDEDTFIVFNSMLDVILDVAPNNDTAARKAATPSMLVNEEARPMLKGNKGELKIGELGLDGQQGGLNKV